MSALSAIIICKNEANNISQCLKSISFADEIIIYDSGSTDKTLEIAAEFTDRIFTDNDWQGFGVQRQRAQDKATNNWVLMIDADERVSEELRDEITTAVRKNNLGNIYCMPRLSYFFGRHIRHGGWYPDYVTRLYPKNRASWTNASVHEKLDNTEDLNVIKFSNNLEHFTYDSLQHYLVKSANYAHLWSQQKVSEGRRSSLTSAFLHGLFCFIRMYILRAGFLDGRQGLLIALLSSHSTYCKHADLWLKSSKLTS